MRLIDADAYENEMSKAYGDDWDKLHILESMPTVDTERHGHWIPKKVVLTDRGDVMYSECSACGGMSAKCEPYCCKCGAKMDEVTEDV